MICVRRFFQVQALFFNLFALIQMPLFPHFFHSSSNKLYPTLDQILLLWNRLNNNSFTLMLAVLQNLMLFKNGTTAALHRSHCSLLQGLYFLEFSSSLRPSTKHALILFISPSFKPVLLLNKWSAFMGACNCQVLCEQAGCSLLWVFLSGPVFLPFRCPFICIILYFGIWQNLHCSNILVIFSVSQQESGFVHKMQVYSLDYGVKMLCFPHLTGPQRYNIFSPCSS